MTRQPEKPLKTRYYLLMFYAALFGALSSLLAAVYITLYNWGIKFFEQPSLFIQNINIWPLVLLTAGGVLVGLVIKFFGEHAGLGVAQLQYSQTGHINCRYVPRILLQAFITLWSGAAVGPEGALVFMSGGFGSLIADRLKLEKDDVPLLVYSAIAGAFGGFFGSPVVGAVGAFEYMFIKRARFLSPPDPRPLRCCLWIRRLFHTLAHVYPPPMNEQAMISSLNKSIITKSRLTDGRFVALSCFCIINRLCKRRRGQACVNLLEGKV